MSNIRKTPRRNWELSDFFRIFGLWLCSWRLRFCWWCLFRCRLFRSFRRWRRRRRNSECPTLRPRIGDRNTSLPRSTAQTWRRRTGSRRRRGTPRPGPRPPPRPRPRPRPAPPTGWSGVAAASPSLALAVDGAAVVPALRTAPAFTLGHFDEERQMDPDVFKHVPAINSKNTSNLFLAFYYRICLLLDHQTTSKT